MPLTERGAIALPLAPLPSREAAGASEKMSRIRFFGEGEAARLLDGGDTSDFSDEPAAAEEEVADAAGAAGVVEAACGVASGEDPIGWPPRFALATDLRSDACQRCLEGVSPVARSQSVRSADEAASSSAEPPLGVERAGLDVSPNDELVCGEVATGGGCGSSGAFGCGGC